MYLKVFPCNFFLNGGESHVVVTSFTHIHSGCSKICCFKFFISCKMLKMLKIGWFKQNYCISGMPQGIPMTVFAQQWWKSCCCDQFYTYSQWFAANFFFKNFNSCKMLKMLKIGWFKQNYCIWGMPRCIPMQFFAQQRWKSCCCDQFYTYSQWFAENLIFSKISIAWKCSICLK